MKFLCIDYGLARTGIAVSDAGGCMAFPRCTIEMPAQRSRADFFEELLQCIAEEDPAGIVVGLPLCLDGSDSLITRQVRNFVARLQRRTSLPVYFMPEELSSSEARQDLRECGKGKKHHKKILDQQAAIRILESFLADTQQEKRRI